MPQIVCSDHKGAFETAMRKRIISFIIFALVSIPIISQGLKYGDLFIYNHNTWRKSADDTIDCQDFFDEYEYSVEASPFIQYECIGPGPINRSEVYLQIADYPEEAKQYQVSGNALIRFLIDKEGGIYCYRIETELGEAFIKQIEAHIFDYQFDSYICSERSVAYIQVVGFQFDYKKRRKKNMP